MAPEGAAFESALLTRDLQRVQRDLHCGVGAMQLGHRRFAREGFAATAQPCCAIGEQTRGLHPGRHVGECEIVALFVAALSLLVAAPAHQLARFVHRGLCDAEALARDADAPRVERSHRDREALPLATEAVVV